MSSPNLTQLGPRNSENHLIRVKAPINMNSTDDNHFPRFLDDEQILKDNARSSDSIFVLKDVQGLRQGTKYVHINESRR